jgi:hypothetical protein
MSFLSVILLLWWWGWNLLGKCSATEPQHQHLIFGGTEPCYVAQAGLKFTILQFCLPSAVITGMVAMPGSSLLFFWVQFAYLFPASYTGNLNNSY